MLALFDPIKEFVDSAIQLHERLHVNFPQIYDLKFNEILQFISGESELFSTLCSENIFYSVEYVLCPHCNHTWELETARSISWHGGGNFRCRGNYQCKKNFRVFKDKGSNINPLAKRLSKDEFIMMFSDNLNEMASKIRADIQEIISSKFLGQNRVN